MKEIHEQIEDTLAALAAGAEVEFRNLRMTPLLGGGVRAPDYLLLDEALEQGAVRITEVSEDGSVPELRLENRAARAVLLLDGEELVGAKQNRVLNVTLLAAAGATLVVPVSCVESGRWSHVSPEFSTARRSLYASGRARKMEQVSASMRATGSPRSDQGAVWDDIDAKMSRVASHSPSAAMAAMYEDHAAPLDDYRNAFRPATGQVGAVFSIDGRACGLELLDAAPTFAKLLPKLVESYALDAIDEALGGGGADAATPDGLLAGLAQARWEAFPAVGEGTDVRAESGRVFAAGLVARDRVVHLSAFAAAAPAAGAGLGRAGSRCARASARRAHRTRRRRE